MWRRYLHFSCIFHKGIRGELVPLFHYCFIPYNSISQHIFLDVSRVSEEWKDICSCKKRGTVSRKVKQILKMLINTSWLQKLGKLWCKLQHIWFTIAAFCPWHNKDRIFSSSTTTLCALCYHPLLYPEAGNHCFAVSTYKTCACFRMLCQRNYNAPSFVSVFVHSWKYFWYTCY